MKVVQYILKNTVLKIFNSKVGTFAVVMLVTAWSYNQPLKQYVHEMNYPVSWCLFPFIMCNFSFLSLFWFGIIYINSDVPFMQQINMYQILRIGRKNGLSDKSEELSSGRLL